MRITLPLLFALTLAAPAARADCPPAGWDAAKQKTDKLEQFVVADGKARA
jgi:hypothetical protein